MSLPGSVRPRLQLVADIILRFGAKMKNTFNMLRRVHTKAQRAIRNPRKAFNFAARQFGIVDPLAAHLQYLNGLPGIAPVNFAIDDRLSGSPRLNVLLPGMAVKAMSGGPNTAINLVYRMAAAGVPLRFISTDIPMDQDQEGLWRHFASLTGIKQRLDNVEIVCGVDRSKPLGIGINDVFFASAWWNVQMIKYALRLTNRKRFLYIIQDFEPSLYPWSTQYALAAETYSMDYYGIFCSNLLAEYFIQSRIGNFADPAFIDKCTIFEPAVDPTKFHVEPAAQLNRPRRLVFYARPTMALRNMFELGLYALRTAVMSGYFSGEDWEMLFIGETLPSAELGPGVTIKSASWLNYDAYAKLMRESDIALSLMLSPHTSYPPLEIAACGGIAVTNIFANKTAERLHGISPNIIGVPPTLEGITGGLKEACERVRNGRRSTRRPTVPMDWQTSFADAVPRAVAMYQSCLNGTE